MKGRFFSLFALAALAMSSMAASPLTVAAQPAGDEPPPPPWFGTGATTTKEDLIAALPRLSGAARDSIMAQYGITSLDGKKLAVTQAYLDSVVSGDSTRERNASIAVNPANNAIMAAVFQYGGECLVQYSTTGGDSWDYNDYFTLPVITGGDTCLSPSVRFAPDGSYAYFVYVDDHSGDAYSDVMFLRTYPTDFSYVDAAPYYQIALYNWNAYMDQPWLEVAPYDSPNPDLVLVTGRRNLGSDCDVEVAANTSYGASGSWKTFLGLGVSPSGTSTGCSPHVFAGPRAIGLAGTYSGKAIMCWFDSEADGFGTGKFDIKCSVNDDVMNTTTWNTPFTAVNDKLEVNEWLTPGSAFESWRASMNPALATDPEGRVYIAFTADPNSNHTDVEAGNVYLTSNPPLALGWTAPATIGSGTLAQGYQTVRARYDVATGKYWVYVAYMDHTSNNAYYRVVYRKGIRSPGSASISWGGKIKVGDVVSLSQFSFVTDYLDSSISSRRYNVIWTDRSDVATKYITDSDVLQDAFVP